MNISTTYILCLRKNVTRVYNWNDEAKWLIISMTWIEKSCYIAGHGQEAFLMGKDVDSKVEKGQAKQLKDKPGDGQ